jgi:hypothetical protein
MVGNVLEIDLLKDQQEDGISWIIGMSVLRMGGGWNWLRIMSSGGLWY